MKTTSLEISKELTAAIKKAGYELPFPSYKFNPKWDDGIAWSLGTMLRNKHYLTPTQEEFNNWMGFDIQAFTMCELWDMLPDEIVDNWYIELSKVHKKHFASYSIGNKNIIEVKDSNPCNTLAKLAIWCIRDGHNLNLKTKEDGTANSH